MAEHQLRFIDGELTNDTFGKGGPLEGGQAQVSDLDGAGGAGDEDVVALEVSVDDGWGSRVKEVEAFENLPAPTSQDLRLHHLEAFQVPAGGATEHSGKRRHFQASAVAFWVVLVPSLKNISDIGSNIVL